MSSAAARLAIVCARDMPGWIVGPSFIPPLSHPGVADARDTGARRAGATDPGAHTRSPASMRARKSRAARPIASRLPWSMRRSVPSGMAIRVLPAKRSA